jgi:hypothetical protein
MFILSPLYLISRFKPGIKNLSEEQIRKIVFKQHEIPFKPFNSALRFVFEMESQIGRFFKFPWGTSILGVFKK